jgi:hypothetical protein
MGCETGAIERSRQFGWDTIVFLMAALFERLVDARTHERVYDEGHALLPCAGR